MSKNTNSENLKNQKPASSKRRKALVGASLMAWLFTGDPAIAQDNSNINEKNQVENVDSLEHQKILNSFCEDLIDEYWFKQWIEIIRKHAFIEINNIRKENGLQKLEENNSLNRASQDYAKYIFDNNHYNHISKEWTNPIDRAKRFWYNSPLISENLNKWGETIKSLIHRFMFSPWHRENILDPYKNDIWIWFYGWKYNYSWVHYIVIMFGSELK